MELKFSQNLIDRTIAYFKKKYDKDISAEVANEYLRSFAGLFLAFTDKKTSADSSRVAEVSHAFHSLKSEPVFPKPEAGLRESSNSSLGASNTQRTLQNETNINI